LAVAKPLHGQGYQVRLDTWFMSYAYRGYNLDSVAASDVVTDANGGLISPDGFAVRCGTGATFCTYFRPQEEKRGNPLVSTLEASLWGLGVQGLSFRLKGRVGADLSDSTIWPAVKPTVQLLEGYAQYRNRWVTALVGRFHEVSRLGYLGVDGAKADFFLFDRKLELLGYAGWGFATGAAIPVTSQYVNPLDQFQPLGRQYVLGAGLGWSLGALQGRWLYQREIDAESDQNYLFSERTALDVTWRPVSRITLRGGAEYDLGVGEFGTADVTLSYATPDRFLGTSIGWRRYRPYFPLWTIWEAFSPVAYDAGWASVYVWPTRGLELRGRGEVFGFQETGASSPNVDSENGGWRYSLGIGYSGLQQWRFDWDYHAEKGPGAQSLGWNARVTWLPLRSVFLTADGGRLLRPLEYRYNDVDLWTAALRADWRPLPDVRAMVEARWYNEDRERPDQAAVSDWDQVRVNAGLTLYFGSGPDTPTLHPAILRIPESRSE
jgi:hypothetical protein